MRVPKPNFTMAPNDLFDFWLPLLKESELKVLLVIMRKTFGWHKVRDAISITQLMKHTGLARETVILAANTLQQNGLIKKEVVGTEGKQNTYYELIISDDSNNSYQSEYTTPPVGFTQRGKNDPQKKPSSYKETAAKEKSAAAPIKNEEKINNAIPYPCLDKLPLDKKQKITISKAHPEPKIIKAVELVLSKKTPPNDLVAFLLWAASNDIEPNKTQEEIAKENKEYAMKYDGKKQGQSIVNAFNKEVEIYSGGSDGNFCLEYIAKEFMFKFTNALRKNKFTILETS